MRCSRAMTLIEVLAAAVILAMLAGAVVPLLADARRTLEHDGVSLEILDLEEFADAFVGSPESFGIDNALTELSRLDVPWPDHPDRPSVLVRLIDGGDHFWIVFECSRLAVSRWLDKPQEDEP